MRPREAVAQARGLARTAAEASRAYGLGRLRTARQVRDLRRRGGWEYRELLSEGLLDPALPVHNRRAAVSRHQRRESQTRLNPLALEPFTEEKASFYRYCAAAGIPVPELYGIVGRAGGWSAASGRVVADRDAFAAFAAEDLPDEFIVKPVRGLLGLGVRLLTRSPDGRLEEHGRGPVDARALYDELAADPEFDLFVVQERLRNHPEIADLCASPVLQTVRIVTIVRRDGVVHLIAAWIKLAVGTGAADNFRAGETGNGLAPIDLRSGRLGPLLLPDEDGRGHRASAVLPGSGRPVEGWQVPHFGEACDLVRAAAPRFLPMRTLGWDVAITPSGPVVVEANNYWASPLVPMDPVSRALLLAG